MLPKSKEILKLKVQGQQAKEVHIEYPVMAAEITVALPRDESRVEQVRELSLHSQRGKKC